MPRQAERIGPAEVMHVRLVDASGAHDHDPDDVVVLLNRDDGFLCGTGP